MEILDCDISKRASRKHSEFQTRLPSEEKHPLPWWRQAWYHQDAKSRSQNLHELRPAKCTSAEIRCESGVIPFLTRTFTYKRITCTNKNARTLKSKHTHTHIKCTHIHMCARKLSTEKTNGSTHHPWANHLSLTEKENKSCTLSPPFSGLRFMVRLTPCAKTAPWTHTRKDLSLEPDGGMSRRIARNFLLSAHANALSCKSSA